MVCPDCNTHACRRSRRQGFDYVIGISGVRPWRCMRCDRRFYAWSVPPAYLFNAHCRFCGNLGLQRISGEFVRKGAKWFWRLVHAPAYRCGDCRHKFYSLLPRAAALDEAPEVSPELRDVARMAVRARSSAPLAHER